MMKSKKLYSNKLFEITKESIKFKFQKNLKVELSKDDKVFEDTIIVEQWLDSNNVEFDDINIKSLLDKQIKEILTRANN